MNSIQKIISIIEKNREVMTAQVERLASVSPEMNFQNVGGPQDAANVSDLLTATVSGHMQGATKALRALSEVEADLRSITKDSYRSITNTNKGTHSEVLDAECSVVSETEDENGQN